MEGGKRQRQIKKISIFGDLVPCKIVNKEWNNFIFIFILNSLYTIALQQINTKKEINYNSYTKII